MWLNGGAEERERKAEQREDLKHRGMMGERREESGLEG